MTDERPLHEQFAERLYAIYGRGAVDARPWSSIGHEARAIFLAHAQEALRWAEWSRRKCVDAPELELRPLSLPPPHWQP